MASDSSNRQYQPLPATDGGLTKAAGSSTMFDAIFNLSKVIIGAGMMAIPNAYFKIGSLIGTSMLVAVGCLTYFTLSVMVRASAATGAITYSQLTAVICGNTVKKVLQVAVLAFCFGFGVVYLVIIRDILAGSPPACTGLLCEMFGVDPTSWVSNPRVVIAAVALLFCSPLLLFRPMDKLAALNVVGVAAIIMLAAVSASLGVSGLTSGSAHSIPLLPQWDLLGPTRAQQLQALTAVIPVMIACYVAHQSLHPLMPLVQPYSEQRMCGVAAAAVAIAFGIFTTLSVGSALAFGPDLEVNVLSNYSVSGLEPLVGKTLARVLSWSIRGGYLLALLASLLLYMHPLRGCLAEIIWQDDEGRQQLAAASASAVHAGSEGTLQSVMVDENGKVHCTDPQETAAYINPQEGEKATKIQGPRTSAAAHVAEVLASGEHHRHEKADVFATAAGVAAAVAAIQESRGSVQHEDGPRIGLLDSDLTVRSAHQTACNNDRNVMWQHTGPEGLANYDAAAAAASTGGSSIVPRWQRAEQQWYYLLTYGLLAVMVLVAVAVPNIWTALSAIGDLASTIQAFVVPGWIAVAMAGWIGSSSSSGMGSAAAAAAGQQQQRRQQHPLLSKDDSIIALLEDGSVTLLKEKSSNEAGNASRLPGPFPSLGDSASAGSSINSSSTGAYGTSSSSSTELVNGGPSHEQLQIGGPVAASAVKMLYRSCGGFVVFLGLALFANGVYHRL